MRTIVPALLSTIALALLSACTTVPSPSPEPGPGPVTRMIDTDAARWALRASRTLDVRTPDLNRYPNLRNALDRKCLQGLSVDIVVGYPLTTRMECARVWVSRHPEAGRGQLVLVQDGSSLVVDGNLLWVDAEGEPRKSQQEFMFQQKLKYYL